ncbi:hypothetical protein SAMN04487859_1402 [Roseovarius lutimaris]|uniref:Uncharacterized protein n=1 Tax=Roseovarius lutimaris TaxID=1005928 RepID=A0A1I5GUT6_9RHOB|nr:hypothetical protein SAMN04487859_1402 [Roseovarius lutimaris]
MDQFDGRGRFGLRSRLSLTTVLVDSILFIFDTRKSVLEKPTLINELSHQEAREYFCRTTSYFDMELPPYFNFQPLLEHSLAEAENIELKELFSWKPQETEGLNYVLMYNKDGDIGWRPFELKHPLIYAKCVDILTRAENWRFVQERLKSFSNGVVECCSLPVVDLDLLPVVSANLG